MGAPWIKHEILGKGGTAIAYRTTRHVIRNHHQEACWKELRVDRRDPDSLECFRREAAIAGDLRHENIPALYEAHLDEHYLIVELVDGCDLRHVLECAEEHRAARTDCNRDGPRCGPLPVPVAIHIAIQTCDALDYLHTLTRANKPAGIVHKDLDPRNILISRRGAVKLIDVGCAAAVSEQSSTVRGKADYMSPEQAFGKPLDGRSDLYSLGVILFELLTGHLPPTFTGTSDSLSSPEALHTLMPHAPPALAALITQLLQWRREDRPASAAACMEALAPLAPSPLVKRELGALSRKARARDTKNYGALQASRLPQQQTPPPAVASRTWRRWAAPAVAVALSTLLVLAVTPEFRPVAGAAPQTEPRPSHPTPTGQPVPEHVAAPIPSPMVNLAATVAVPSTPEASLQEPTAPAPAHTTALPAAASSLATLHIFAAPPAMIWIGDRSYGKSPVHARLAPGAHVIRAGSKRRTVTVRGAEERDEIFDLTQAAK